MQRVVIPELLDSDSGTPSEVAASLRDLRDLNRFLGGIGFTSRMIVQAARKANLQKLSVLDVAGGEGYVLSRILRRLRAAGLEIAGTVLDRASTHMRPAAYGFQGVRGDALALPFCDGAFDIVSSNLFVHHLEPSEVECFFREAARVARHAVIINDLERNGTHLRFAQLGKLVYRSRITRNDAVASVKRAYTMSEFEEMVHPLGLRYEIVRGFFYRIGICIWKTV